jgi:adenosine deaminase
MRRWLACFVFAGIGTVAASAQPQRAARVDGAEAATARRLAAIRNDPPSLRAFLREMPKGGDLHNHLSGSIYAESYLRWAAEDQLCWVVATMTIAAGSCDPAAGRPPVSAVLQNSTLYNQAIDALSMRNWNPALNGHDHFFATFDRFSAATVSRRGEMLAEIVARAASERVSYMELMLSPASASAVQFASRIDRMVGASPDLARAREQLLAAGFVEAIRTETRSRLDLMEARQRDLLRCGTPQADAGCKVTVRYIAQVQRASPPELVFTQMVAGFELVAIEPRLVSLNLVQPEDDPNALRYFALQMAMLDFLHRQYARVPIVLHAGELAEGLVPPEALGSHVKESIRTGHAIRIGHGADVFDEDDPFALVKEMAAKKILVEVALSSSEQILGLRGTRQPLRFYLQHGVPVALATDDMGVARSSHTHEFVKAVEEHDLDYLTLKRLARNSIDYAFADAATKARLKADLEAALAAFERRQSAGIPKS